MLLSRNPFAHSDHGRSLWLILDDETVEDEPAVQLLRELRDRPSAQVYSTDRASPKRVRFGSPVHQRDYVEVFFESSVDRIPAGIPAHSSIRAQAVRVASEYGLDQFEAERLLLLGSLSRTDARVDGLILSETVPLSLARRLRSLTPAQGVALLGLNLRAHGDFAVAADRTLGAALFYRTVAFHHVAALEPWLAAAMAMWRSGEHRSFLLLDGAATRLGRALRARDYLQVRLRAEDYPAVWDEVLFFFEATLLQLMGALDLIARLFHGLYEIQGRGPSWRDRRKRGWLELLALRAPALAANAKPTAPLGDIVDLIAELRNRIHEAPPSERVIYWEDAPAIAVWGTGLVALRADAATTRLLAAAERRGGLTDWGLSDRSADQAVTFDPGLYAEQALRSTMTAIGDTLALAESEWLNPDDPFGIADGVPPIWERQNAGWLFGLQPGGLLQDRVTSA